jgi:hypothetical protein
MLPSGQREFKLGENVAVGVEGAFTRLEVPPEHDVIDKKRKDRQTNFSFIGNIK